MKEQRFQESQKIKMFLKGDIIYGAFKEPVNYDLELAREALRMRKKISQGEDFHLLFDGRKMHGITKEARDYLSSEEAMENVSSGAVVIDSVLGRIIVQLFLALNKPSRPFKFFNSISEAERWLEKQPVFVG